MRHARAIVTIGDGTGLVTQHEVEHCCHCGTLLGRTVDLFDQRQRGEGAFGYCAKCHALHCPRCQECRTQERAAENVEAGRRATDDGPLRVFVRARFPGK